MFDKLLLLLGMWKGEGTAFYPTITQQDYDDQLVFDLDEPRTVIQYEQKTWRKESGLLLHWEFGFIRLLEDGSVLINNTQNNGRLEVMNGEVSPLENGFQLTLTTSVFSNDPRMLKAERTWQLAGDQLTYHQAMATQTVNDFQAHLEASLLRC